MEDAVVRGDREGVEAVSRVVGDDRHAAPGGGERLGDLREADLGRELVGAARVRDLGFEDSPRAGGAVEEDEPLAQERLDGDLGRAPPSACVGGTWAQTGNSATTSDATSRGGALVEIARSTSARSSAS